MPEQLEFIPMDRIYPPYLLMRLVDRRNLAYLELRDSIKAVGLLSPICVRHSERQQGWYEIIAGMWRWSCCSDLRMRTIPAIIKEADNTTVLKMQLMENAVRAATKPVEYANQMKRLFMADPSMKFAHLSAEIKKSPIWIKKMLGLLNLFPDAQQMVDRGEILLSSAYMLAKLPKWMQTELIEEAVFMSAKEFCALCRERLLEYKQNNRQDYQTNYWKNIFEPHPYMQFYRVLVAEWKHHAVGPALLVRNNIIKPIDAWNLALAWVLHMDPDNLIDQEQRAKEKLEQTQKNTKKRADDRHARFDTTLIEKMPDELA